MTQPAPGYQPYQPPPAMQPMMGVAGPPKRPRGGVTSLLAAVLALLTAGLTIGGLFGPISSFKNSVDFGDGEPPTEFGSHQGWWGYTDNGSTSPIENESSLFGLILALAVLLLVIGAVFMFVAARVRTSGPTSAGRSLITGGVGVLAGAILLELLDVLAQMTRYNERELDAGESLDFKAGLGLYLPLGALVLGLVAVVLAHVGRRGGGVRMEPNTPRMGFQAPYGYQQQGGRPQQGAAPTGVAGAPGAPGAPGAMAAGAAGAPLAERATEVERPSPTDDMADVDSDADDTQVVSNATAGGAPANPSLSAALEGDPAQSATPPVPAAGPAIASLTQPSATTDRSGTAQATGSPASPAAPWASSTESPASAPSTATQAESPTAAPSAADLSAATNPAAPTPGTDSAATPTSAPATPQSAPAGSTPPAATPPSVPATTPPPAASEPAEPTPLSDLPAAPPPPELSSSDEPKKNA